MKSTAELPASERQQWLSVLAHAPRESLQQLLGPLMTGLQFEPLRAPEVGLTMLRARAGNSGERFNLGEATLTRCVLRCVLRFQGEDHVSVGVGYVLGRDVERASWVAQADALLQQPAWVERLQAEVIAPLRALTQALRVQQASETAASRVQFYTLQAEIQP
ncbi:phosphonate C-P lyase system protein PhnG [Paucibacter sp. B2R-40]|uniref:phosphonate C-P lyase system protein PhnG n=1 Tax=Paucibacter sp. B2R-40 TaxID=2893554 RepID=UPI0021E43E28|nr:phosphonate C-P lyase system protein PhnG [Paucibacter sp. B2R-40]MCV2352797.1 phosphonate C-P lyase system protein PhnG [Paucibacter sp. B2R-40]